MMAGQLIPLPDLDAQPSRRGSMQQRISAWFDMLEFGEQMYLAGQQSKEDTPIDRHAVVQQWYEQGLKEHDRMLWQLMTALEQRS